MQWTKRWWRYAALLGSSAILLQTTTGCPVDQATMANLMAQVVAQFLQAAMSGQYCSTA
jgi:hypothetical protein